MDTAKAANLYTTWPADLLTYVNPPSGGVAPVPGPLTPLDRHPHDGRDRQRDHRRRSIFDCQPCTPRTGIAHRRLRPTLGIIDPLNTHTMPRMVTACTGFDVLVHALESYTTLPFTRRAAPASPAERPAYQGANPVTDVWAARPSSWPESTSCAPWTTRPTTRRAA